MPNDPHVVIMFEPRHPQEPEMTASSQVNEVFGPFPNGDEASKWADKARMSCKTFLLHRYWLVIPLREPLTDMEFLRLGNQG